MFLSIRVEIKRESYRLKVNFELFSSLTLIEFIFEDIFVLIRCKRGEPFLISNHLNDLNE